MARSKFLSASPSAVDTHLSCPRKRWFQRVLKMPEPPRRSTLLGDVGHNVIERYLDDKEMYPEGWEFPVNRWSGKREEKGASPSDQRMIQSLIKCGIEEGTIVRAPDGQTEKKHSITLFEEDGVKCVSNAYIDYATGEEVQDHKFCASPKYYGPAKLKKAVPMLFYAACEIMERGLHETDPDGTHWLQYNLFIKDEKNLRTKKVRAEVKIPDVLAWADNVYMPACKEMANITKQNPKEEDWASVKGAEGEGDYGPCGDYGGCAYREICDGCLSTKDYRSKFDKDRDPMREKALAKVAGETTKEKAMSFRDKIAAKNAARAAETNETEPTTPAPTEAPATEAVDKPAAPWHVKGCGSCADNDMLGVSSSGRVCLICKTKGKNLGLPATTDYKISVEEGAITVINKETGEIEATTGAQQVKASETTEHIEKEEKAEPPATKKVTKKKATTKKATTKKAAPKTEEEPPADEPPADEPPADEPPAEAPVQTEFNPKDFKPERMEFTLSYAAVRSRSRNSTKVGDPTCVLSIGDVYNLFEQMVMSADPSLTSLASMSDFDRFGMFNANGKEIAEALGKSTIDASVTQRGGDFSHLCCAIEQYAIRVYGSLK